jgi:hypothetical protein
MEELRRLGRGDLIYIYYLYTCCTVRERPPTPHTYGPFILPRKELVSDFSITITQRFVAFSGVDGILIPPRRLVGSQSQYTRSLARLDTVRAILNSA